MARKTTGYGTSAIEEERRRLQEEEERRRQEEAARRSAEEAQKAAADAADAAAVAAPPPPETTPEPAKTEPVQPKQIDAASVNTPDSVHSGVRSSGLPKVRQEDIDKTKFLGDVRTSVLDTQFGVVGSNYVAQEYKEFQSEEDQVEHYASRMASHAAGMGGDGERGAGNTINVNRESFKDAKQAVLFSTTMTDSKNQYRLLCDYAEDIGVDPYAFVAEAEKWMKNTYNRDLFSVPQTDSGKIQAANKTLGGIGLTDIGGNALDIVNATPQQWVQALHMNPDPSVHDEAWKAIQVLQKTPGSRWYGMDLKKDDFGFLDSADLTKADYDAAAKDFAASFVYSDNPHNEQNMAAYVDAFENINATYSENPRIRGYMLSLLEKTWEERTPGYAAPDAATVEAFLSKQAEARTNDPNASADDQAWYEKMGQGLADFFGIKKKDKTADETLDAIIEQNAKDEQEAMDGMVGIDEDGNVAYRGIGGDVALGNVYAEPAAAEAPEVQGPQMPASKTASGSNNLASAANAEDFNPFQFVRDHGGVMVASAGASSGVNFVPGAKNLSAVGQMIAADQPSIVVDEHAKVSYDPNMSDATAMLHYLNGQELDGRNLDQIKPIINNKSRMDFVQSCIRGYSVSDMYGGDVTDYNKGVVANRAMYGPDFSRAMMALQSEALSPEMRIQGALMLENAKGWIDNYIETPMNGFIQTFGQNQYQAVVEQFPEFLGAQLKQVEGLLGEQINAEADVARENKETNRAMAEGYQQDAIEGRLTADGAAWLALEEEENVDEDVYFSALNDEGLFNRNRAIKQSGLFGGGEFWKDDFWKGEGAAAIEMRNITAVGGEKEGKKFRGLLGETMGETLQDLSIDAHQSGKTLDEYLKMAGMDMGDVANLALTSMIRAGKHMKVSPEAQKALETISIGKKNALAVGFKMGMTKTNEGFAEGAQLIVNDIVHERDRFDAYNKFVGEFGTEQAPYMARKTMFEYANSGALSEESKAEMLYALERSSDIFDVWATYSKQDGLKGYLDGVVNDLQGDLETMQTLVSSLSDDERKAANLASGVSNTLSAMTVGTVGGVLFGPFGGSLIMSSAGWADRQEYYRYQKGMSDGLSSLASSVELFALAGANTYGMSSFLDDILGASGYSAGLKRQFVKNNENFIKSLPTAMKYGGKSALHALVTEGVEGMGEVVIEKGVELGFDVIQAEIDAINRGEGASFVRPLLNMADKVTSTDPTEVGMELLEAFGAEGVMGAVFRIGGNIIATPFAFAGAGKLRKYDSMKMALKLSDGDIPMTEENIGKLMLSLKSDMEDPDFVRILDSRNQIAQEQKNLAAAIVSDTASPERKRAVETSLQAETYRNDADTARSAADVAKTAYFDLSDRASAGDLDAIPDLREARDKWSKAETAYKEAKGAYKKTAKEAAWRMGEWFNACREASKGIGAEDLRRNLDHLLEEQKKMAAAVVAKMDAEAVRTEQDAEVEPEAEVIAQEAAEPSADMLSEEEVAKNAEFEAEVSSELESVNAMSDEEIDADIAQIIENETSVPAAQAEAEEMGYDQETLQALEEQTMQQSQSSAARKEAIIRNQRNQYRNLADRAAYAREMGDTDAEAELSERMKPVQARLEALGVGIDQETNAPEPSTQTEPAKPVGSADVVSEATTAVSPEPSTETPAAKPVIKNVGQPKTLTPEQQARKDARIEKIKELIPNAFVAAKESQMARIQSQIDGLNEQMLEEYDKGENADPARLESLSTQSGILSVLLDDMQKSDETSEVESIMAQVDAELDAIESEAAASAAPVMQAREARIHLEDEQKALKGVFGDLRNKSIYVNADQLSNILYETGAKNISEFNRTYGTKLTQNPEKGIPLDGGFYKDMKAQAPGYFMESWDAHPEAAIVYMANRKKTLAKDLADSRQAETDAYDAYQQSVADGYKGIEKEIADIQPGHALSQFENKTLPESDVSTPETDEILRGTTHEVHKQSGLVDKAKRAIAKAGLKQTIGKLMSLDHMDDQDMATAYQCLEILKKNGDIRTHAMLSVKVGRVRTKTAQALRTTVGDVSKAAAETVEMADAYNRKKGFRKSVNMSEDAEEQFSLGDTKNLPFMDTAISRATSDPMAQKLSSDVAKRSELSLYWADMPDGMRGFFDRARGVIVLNQRVGASQGAYVTAIHEFTHHMENDAGYAEYSNAVLKAAYGRDYENSDAMLMDETALRDEYNERGQELTDDLLRKELVAAATEKVLLGDEAFMRTLFERGNGGVAVRMLAGMDSFLRKNAAKKNGAEALSRYDLIKAARNKMQMAVKNSGKWKAGENGNAQLAIARDSKGRKRVKADRQVILSKDPAKWNNEIQTYIQNTIRKNGDITIYAEDGDVLVFDDVTQWHAGSRNKNTSDAEYRTKINASAHLDELAQIARDRRPTAPNEPDRNGKHGNLASQGWRYKKAVFEDYDGQLYRVMISVAHSSNQKTLYNIGETIPVGNKKTGSAVAGSSGKVNSPVVHSASGNNSIQNHGTVVKKQSMPNTPQTIQKKDDQFRSPDGSRGRSDETSSSDTIIQHEASGVNNQNMQNGPQLSFQVERQDGRGNRQQEISDPDTYDRITADMPSGDVTMREQPDVEQTRIEEKKQIGETTRKVLANIDALNEQEDVNTDNPWRVPLNAFQRGLIKRFKLEDVKLPGINYNHATTKQRMLCAILATPRDNRGSGVMTLTQQLQALKAGKQAVVTDADYNYIISQAAIVEGSEVDAEGIPLEREGQQAYARLRDAQANIEPTRWSDKLSAWRFMNLLSSPVTTIKNVDGNLIIQEADRVSTWAAEWLDKMVAKKTGTRSTSFATKQERKAGTEAAMQRGRDAYDDYFVAQANTSRSRNYEIGGDGRVFESEPLEFMRNLVGFAMDAPDQMMMEKTLVEEMAVLERIDAKIMDDETGEMRSMTESERYEEAFKRASERFYHDNNAMTRIMNTVYQVPFVGTAARILIPFVKTPSNVALRMFDYSPLGLAKSAFYDGLYLMNHNKGDQAVGAGFDQRKFVMGMGRGMTGTAMTVLGMALYNYGYLSFGREDEENANRRNALASLGEPYSMYVNIGNTKHEIAFSLPATSGLSIGAGIAKKIGDKETIDNIAMGILVDQFNQIFDNTYLSSINDIFRGYEDGTGVMTRLRNTTAESYMQQMFSPAALRAIAKMQDPYARDTGSESGLRQMINETVIQNWPGIRKTLPVKYDVTGDAMTQHKAYQEGGAWENAVMNFVDSMLSPTSTYSDKNDEQLIELLDMSYRTGETAFLPPASFATKNKLYVTKTIAKKLRAGDAGFDVRLDDAQMRKVNQMYSDILFNGTGELKIQKPGSVANYRVNGLRDVMTSKEWQKMSDNERIDKVDELKKTVKELMTVYVVRNYN